MVSTTPPARWPSTESALKQAGFRLTRPRKAILTVLSGAGESLTPEEVLEKAEPLCPGIGLVTVYRTLALLSDLGQVRRLHQEDRCLAYVAANLAHGHHVVCRRCRRAVEFPGSEDLGAVIGEVARQTGFLVDDHLLELMGICPDCQTTGRPPAGARRAK